MKKEQTPMDKKPTLIDAIKTDRIRKAMMELKEKD